MLARIEDFIKDLWMSTHKTYKLKIDIIGQFAKSSIIVIFLTIAIEYELIVEMDFLCLAC